MSAESATAEAASAEAASAKVETAGSLVLPAALARDLDRRAAAGYPHEVCGLLLGSHGAAGEVAGGASWRIDEVTESSNLASERLEDRYILDPAHYLEADRRAREKGLDVVGVWHTHPDHPPIPSATDREHAWDGFAYLILPTTKRGTGEGRAWVLGGDGFLELDVETV